MHLYEPKSFSAEQESLLRYITSPAKYYENFLTQEEFDQCRKLTLSVKKWPEHGKVSKYWGFGLSDPAGKKFTWLWEKIHNLVPDTAFDFFAVQESINPWKIHADIRWHADRIPHKVFLLPMDVEPISGPIPTDQWPNTYTITFNQRNFLNRWGIERANKESAPGNDQDKWVRPCDNIQTEKLVTGYHIGRDTWQQYLSHIPYEHLEGLTVDCINLWQPRAMMHWDNTALHCADDFLTHGIRTKRCLMLFSALKQ